MTPARAASERPGLTDAFAPLSDRTFRAIWTASVASNFGALVQGVGAAWLMTSISTSEQMVALVQASTTLPIMAFSLVSGAVADGYDRRRVMLVAQTFMFAVSIALALAAWTGGITPWTLLAFTFAIGSGGALNNPSWQASVGDIVGRERLGAAVLLNSVSFNLTRSLGPALGGAIVAAGGAAAAFTVNALSYLPLIAVLVGWKPPEKPALLPREPFLSAMTSGLRYVALSPNIARVMLRAFAFGVTSIAVLALLPVVARDQSGSAIGYGGLLGAFGVGALVGAFASARLRARLSNENLVRLAFATFALAAMLIAASLAFGAGLWLTALALPLGGASWVVTLSLFNTIVQLSSPRWVVGRALSLYQMASFGGMALGAWGWGSLTEATSLSVALACAAIAMLAGAALGVRVPLPSRTALDLDPRGDWQPPALELDLLPRSGPVAIFIDYEIEDDDLPAFLEAMEERRRIRTRNGAHTWRLTQDLEDHRLWRESYKIATWTEYLRHMERTTKADAAVGERLRALHAGPKPPVIHRMIVRHPARLSAREAAPFHPHLDIA